tara:strand:+ start:361 stop:492 length:132 start_codon:yes stop_codon:yes gene_type:complete
LTTHARHLIQHDRHDEQARELEELASSELAATAHLRVVVMSGG